MGPLPSRTLEAPPSALSRPRVSHQFVEIIPQADKQGPMFQNADRYHPREGLSDGLRLPDSGVLQASSSVWKDVVADSRPHALSGRICSQKQCQDVFSPMASGAPLGSSSR